MFSFTRSSRQTTYERLTTSPEPGPSGYHPKANTLWYRLLSTRFSTRRTRRNVVLAILSFVSCVVVVVLVLYGPLLYRILELPSYRRYREAENSRRPGTIQLSGTGLQRGKSDVKYFFPEKRLIGAGWGNIVQEQILNALLAYAANRSLVYTDYTWRDGPLPFSVYYANMKPIPSRIPLSVFIDGPIIGKPSPFSHPSFSSQSTSMTMQSTSSRSPFLASLIATPPDPPPAISETVFREVCAEMGEEVHYVDVDEASFMWHDEKYGLDDILEFWVRKLDGIEAKCVSTGKARRGLERTIWEYWIFDVPKLLDIWPLLKSSPILTQFSSSPLVLLGLEANKRLLGLLPSPAYANLSPPFSLSTLSSSSSDSSNHSSLSTLAKSSDDPLAADSTAMQQLKDAQYDIIEGLLVLHVRRGDYETHCPLLATKAADWQGMVQLATRGMEDDLNMKSMVLHRPPAGSDTGGEDWKETFQRRCFPSIENMVLRVGQIRLEFPHLDRLYIMTNAKSDFLSSLASALLASSSSHVDPLSGQSLGPWKSVHHSRDLVLDDEQSFVAQAVDMAIGVKADVLLGNGWSSLTSHVVMMRMSRDVEARRSRMW